MTSNQQKTCSSPFCTIIFDINLGWCHHNLFTFSSLPRVKKKNKLLWNFLMKSRNLLPIAIQRCLVLNLPQNKFHNLKSYKLCITNFHPKFSWECPKLMYKIILQNRHEQVYSTHFYYLAIQICKIKTSQGSAIV